MKRVVSIFLIINLLCALVIPIPTSAKTLGDLERELDALEAKYEKQENEQQKTEEEIATTKNDINTTRNKITKAQEDVVKLNNEIKQLNKDIEKKDAEIKEIMSFVQLSNGESAYLEYAFGAQDFTDFIYRVAVSEQLANYNDELIDSFNKMIKTNKQKTKELKKKEEELTKLEESLKKQLDKLGNRLEDIIDIKVDVEKDIKTQREAIKLYKSMGCKTNEDISNCGRNILPPETALWRPVNSGMISSNYGNRCYYLGSSYVCDFHTGIDMANSGTISVYAAGTGVVVGTTYHSSCGGNIIYVSHNINGTTYTTVYMHLRRMYVQKGDVVTKNTVIGIMGGNPSSEWWDSCSTGQHLHFMVSRGIYRGYDSVIAGLMNPRTMVNFPSEGNWFTDRTSRY